MTNAMKYIYTIYKTRSFSTAAELLFISQPALSIAVRKEEDLWGSAFFDRNTHPLKLTPAGELYVKKAEEIWHLEYELKQQLADLSDLSSGELYIAGTQYTNSYVLPPMINHFMKQYPGIQIKIHEGSPNANLQALQNGQVSVSFNAGTFDSQLFTQAPVFQDYILLAVPRSFAINKTYTEYALSHEQICSPEFSWSVWPQIPAECFADIPMIFLSSGTNLHQITMEICHDAGFTPNVLFKVDQSTTAYNLARADIGAVWVSNLIINHSPACDMVYYQVKSDKTRRSYYALTSKKRYTDKATAEFIRICQQLI